MCFTPSGLARKNAPGVFVALRPWLPPSAVATTNPGYFSGTARRMTFSTPARACGIDFGTSNSTVGWLRPDAETLIPREDGKITLPSVVF
jgi:hypothetical protein